MLIDMIQFQKGQSLLMVAGFCSAEV